MEIEFDKAFLPPTATLEDVKLEIQSWKVDGKENIVSSHTFVLNSGIEAHKIAVCYEIVDRNTGEFHHYQLTIYCVQKYSRKGWVVNNTYQIKSLQEIKALKETLEVILEENLGRNNETRILVNKIEYEKLIEISERSESEVVQNLLQNKDGIEEIFLQGGEYFFNQFIQWFRKNQHIEGVVELFNDMLGVFGEMKLEDREKILELFRKQNLTREDLDILSGRKLGLQVFEQQLEEDSDWGEKEWQEFFENNDWILGYGLDYKFLQILQREVHLSDVDLDGKNDVIGDFLTGCSNFTVLVELKRPDTDLFKETQNRASSWKLSSHLTDAVSQILAQKAKWEIKSEGRNYNEKNELITQETHDPKTILVIGNTKEFQGDDRISQIKRKSFELFRRNLRNIEIFTFDELLNRAKFIVRERNFNNEFDDIFADEIPVWDDDDIPF